MSKYGFWIIILILNNLYMYTWTNFFDFETSFLNINIHGFVI